LLVLGAKRSGGHLGGIEETRTVWTSDGAQQNALRDTRDEVAYGFRTVESGEIVTVCPGCVHRGEDFAFALGAGLLEGMIPGGSAAGDGGVGVGR